MSPSYPGSFPLMRVEHSETALRTLARLLLVALVFTIPWEDEMMIEGVGTLSRAVGMAASAVAVLAVWTEARIRIPRPAHFVLAGFVLWGSLSSLWSVDLDATIYWMTTYMQLAVLLWLVLEFAPEHDDQLQLMRAYVLGSFISAGGTIYSYYSDSTAYWQRHVAAGFDPNDLCVIFAISIPMSFYLMASDRSGWIRWLWRVQPAPVFLAAVLTASRGGILALGAALLIVPLLFPRLPRDVKLAILPAAALASAGIWMYVPVETLDRLASIPQEIGGGGFGERGAIWRAGLDLFQQHPLLGVGLGAFAPAINPFVGESVVAHNAFLTVLVETGLAGFALFAAALYLLIRMMRGMTVMDRRFWAVVLVTWVLGAMSLSWAHRKPTWLVFALVAAYSRPIREASVKEGAQ